LIWINPKEGHAIFSLRKFHKALANDLLTTHFRKEILTSALAEKLIPLQSSKNKFKEKIA
jgi:hypothetical protein